MPSAAGPPPDCLTIVIPASARPGPAPGHFRKRGCMRVSVMIRVGAGPGDGLMDRITNYGRQVEARGFPGIWIGDSLGRGRPTLDSLQVLTALAAVPSKVELGIIVL